MGRKITFESEARDIEEGGKKYTAAWTDGLSIQSDKEPLCAYRLEKGKKYKVTVEEID